MIVQREKSIRVARTAVRDKRRFSAVPASAPSRSWPRLWPRPGQSVLEWVRETLVNTCRNGMIMYVIDKLAAFLTLLCRVFGVTPDTIKAFKDKNKRPQITTDEAAARVKGLIVS